MIERTPEPMFPRETAQLRILQILAQEPGISQRRLAERLGVSVGKTHYLLKALLEKGLIKVDNFRRSDRKLAYLYLLTPRGIETKLRLTRAYLARKEAEYKNPAPGNRGPPERTHGLASQCADRCRVD
jgi:EPS-associated MarR family transcriptional regulator